jgi:GxxExxY protein
MKGPGINQLSSQIIGAAIEVHKQLGPGLLESAYEECLCYELKLRGLSFERQKPVPIEYKGTKLDCGYRLDVLVENQIVLELKACSKLEPIHTAQLLTYLKLSGFHLGLLLNFNSLAMRNGILRVANHLEE